MKTKQQKIKEMEQGEMLLRQSRGLVFVEFTGASVEDLKSLRKILKNFGAKLKIVKKRLLRIIFEKEKVDFNPEQFKAQIGVIFTDRDASELAAPVYKFAKDLEKKGFKILGAYDLAGKGFINSETMVKIGQLPPREILLAQLVGLLSMPIRTLMYIMQERAKKVAL